MIDHDIKDAIRKIWDDSSGMYDDCSGHGIRTEEESIAWKQELSWYQRFAPARTYYIVAATKQN